MFTGSCKLVKQKTRNLWKNKLISNFSGRIKYRTNLINLQYVKALYLQFTAPSWTELFIFELTKTKQQKKSTQFGIIWLILALIHWISIVYTFRYLWLCLWASNHYNYDFAWILCHSKSEFLVCFIKTELNIISKPKIFEKEKYLIKVVLIFSKFFQLFNKQKSFDQKKWKILPNLKLKIIIINTNLIILNFFKKYIYNCQKL